MKLFQMFTIVLMTSLVLFSCKKDDDLNGSSNENVSVSIIGTYEGLNVTTNDVMTVNVEDIDNNTIAMSVSSFDPITITVITNPSDPNIVNNQFGQNDGITAVFNLEKRELSLIDENQEFIFQGTRRD
ncbi:MAG: hypothetical protein AAF573_03775 [Bacteroidota bacterium]